MDGLLFLRHLVILEAIKLTLAAAYIILGLMLIGRELENPFGTDITDIDMDLYIRQLKIEINIITSNPSPKLDEFVATEDNVPLGPKSKMSYSTVKSMSIEGVLPLFFCLTIEIRAYLRKKPTMGSVDVHLSKREANNFLKV